MVDVTVTDLTKYLQTGTQIFDARQPEDITSGFLSGSVFLQRGQNLPFYLNAFFDAKAPLIIVTNAADAPAVENEVKNAGFSNICGFVEFDRQKFEKAHLPLDLIIDVDGDEFAMDINFDSQAVIVDLRSAERYLLSHVKNSITLPLAEMADVAEIAGLDEEGTVYFYSEGIDDAITAAMLLKRQGLHNLRVVNGGWEQIQREKSIEVEKVKREKKS